MSGAPYRNNSEFVRLDLERGQLHPSALASPALQLLHTHFTGHVLPSLIPEAVNPSSIQRTR